jgi:anaerobic magnesium-protoporphyrin IX monomethyl ester cyclase
VARVLFLQNIEYDFPGVMYISALVKSKGHDCDLLIETKPHKIVQYARKSSFDIFAFSMMSGVHHWALDITNELKKVFPDVPVIYGGVHPTYFPEVIYQGPVDIICIGEGEFPMLDLMDALDKKEDYSHIQNLWVKKDSKVIKNPMRSSVEDLDVYPIPDRELYYAKYSNLRNTQTKSLLASRGCPYSCSFCFNKKLKEMYSGKGKYVRYHSVNRVIEEMQYLKNNYPLKTINISDDIFILDRKRAINVLNKMIETKVAIPFFCLTRSNLLDEVLVRKLKEAGCVGGWFGMESGNEKLRQEVLNKNITNEQIIKGALLLHKYGIKFRAYCMIGTPGETLENAFETINLNIQIKTDFPWCSIYTPYSKTQLVEYAVKSGFLDKSATNNPSGTIWQNTVLQNDENRQLMNLHKFFQTSILMPWTFPIVKRLIKLPNNPLFFLWFGIVYTYVYIKSERHGVWDTMKFLLKYIPIFMNLHQPDISSITKNTENLTK